MRTAPLPAFALCLAIGCAASSAFAQRGDRANDPQPEPTFDLPPPAPLDPTAARAAFTLQPGYRIEAFATEPMVQAPVALAFAADGAAWVVEMRGYMNDVDAGGEDQPIGRIVVLRDTDGDGRADVAKTFLDAVVMPRAVLPMRGGALVVVPPLLVWCPDADGDGVADRMETVVGGFDAGLSNPEHAGNGPVVGFDGWISFCNYPLALRRVSDSAWATRATFGGGQWGHGHDDFGRLWFDYNSDGLRVDVLPSHLALHRTLGAMPGLNVQALRDQSVFPIRATPGVNRGYQKGLLKDNRLAVFTAACGVVVDRGGVVSDGDAFFCEPAGHVVRRCEVAWDATGRPTARNAYAGAEWLASTDERFRPVNLAVGLDGAIYVVDMYRGVLQHRNFVTTWLRKQIVARELETPLDRGRIWRVVREPAGERADAPLGVAGRSEAELVALLTDRNGVVRDLAQQALVEIGPALADATVAALSRLAANGDDARWRLHALWTLARTARLAADAWRARLADEHPQVRTAALRIGFDERPPTVDAAVATAAMLAALDDASIEVRRVAMLLAARVAPSDDRVFAALLRDGGDAMVRGGYLIGNVGRELDVLRKLGTEW
jgi:hypothetical protein